MVAGGLGGRNVCARFFVMAPRRPRNSSPPISPVAEAVGGWLGGTRAEQYRPPGRDAFRPRETVEFETARPDGSGNQTEFQYRTTRVDYPQGIKQPYKTFYDQETLPVFPQPQLIENLPFQKAGDYDRFNQQRKVGTAAELRYVNQGTDPNQNPFADSDSQMNQFLRQVDTVIVNPKYKIPELPKVNRLRAASSAALRKGNRQTAFRAAESADRLLAKFAKADESLRQMAKANSAYFGKEFKVLPMPEMGYLPNTTAGNMYDSAVIKVDKKKTKQYNEYLKKGYENKPLPNSYFNYFENPDYGNAGYTFAGKQYNPNRTLRLNVDDETNFEVLGRGRLASFHQDRIVNKPRDPRSGKSWKDIRNTVPGSEANRYDSEKNTTPLQAWMTLNTRIVGLDTQKHADHVAQHEFGHAVLGQDHSLKYADPYGYSDTNTAMTYDSSVEQYGATLLPSDINYIKQVQSGLKNQAALQAKAYKAAELRKQNIKIAKANKKKNNRLR